MPGGDSYFGALLNSWIHVMMYSYYALALLKISCPWKKYLTQAQLLQFLSVLIYTGYSYSLAVNSGAKWPMLSSYYVQAFEMISLFILFTLFYRKAYSKKKRISPKEVSETSSDTPDQRSLSSASAHS